jgi:hypothetical protein
LTFVGYCAGHRKIAPNAISVGAVPCRLVRSITNCTALKPAWIGHFPLILIFERVFGAELLRRHLTTRKPNKDAISPPTPYKSVRVRRFTNPNKTGKSLRLRTPSEDFGHRRSNRRDERLRLQADCDRAVVQPQSNFKLTYAIHDNPRGNKHE